jgi:hypothetical protein
MVLTPGADRGDGDGDRGALMLPLPLDDYWPYKEAIRQLELMLDAAAGVPLKVSDTARLFGGVHGERNPKAWEAVEKALGALLDRVVEMIVEMASNPELGPLPCGTPTFQEMRDTLDKVHESQREPTDRALTFIENWLKQYRAKGKKIQTRERRNRKVLDMYAEMEKGLSRKQALANIRRTEEEIQKYVGPLKRALEKGGMDIPKPKRSPRRPRS